MLLGLQHNQRRQVTRVTRPRVHRSATSMLTRLRRPLLSTRKHFLLIRLMRPTRLLNRLTRLYLQLRNTRRLNVRFQRSIHGTNIVIRLRTTLRKTRTIMGNVQRTHFPTNVYQMKVLSLIFTRVVTRHGTRRANRHYGKLSTILRYPIRGTLLNRPRPNTTRPTLPYLRRVPLRHTLNNYRK